MINFNASVVLRKVKILKFDLINSDQKHTFTNRLNKLRMSILDL